ncbi:MAG: hypothetical protein AAF715_14195 [Myxococcota bacterium]
MQPRNRAHALTSPFAPPGAKSKGQTPTRLGGMLTLVILGAAACGSDTATTEGAGGAGGGVIVGGTGGLGPSGSGGDAGGASSGDGGGGGIGGGTGGSPSTGTGDGGYGGSFDAPLACDGTAAGPIFATDVLFTGYGPGQDFGRDQMPGIALGHPEGGGCCAGSLDVVSLGVGGVIVLGFEGNGIVDGPGPDFVVFENPFLLGGTDESFAELATVEVSPDGQTWTAFPCTATAAPYDACAGIEPVTLDADVAALDPAVHGGDKFDLADVGVADARFIRITDRADRGGSVFDLDAVGIVNAACP